MTAKSFNFNVQLALSQTEEVHALVKEIMFEKFAGELLAIHQSHKENDKLGSDYALEFHNGKFEHLDVKVRSRDYYSETDKCNIAIEPSTGNKIGWALDANKITDWVLFVFPDTKLGSLHHARTLRTIVRKHWNDWQCTHKQSTQVTAGGYKSPCFYISDHELWAAEYKQFSYAGSLYKARK